MPFAIHNIRIEKPWHTAGAFFAVFAAISLHFSPALGSILGVLAFCCAAVSFFSSSKNAFPISSLLLITVFVAWQCIADGITSTPVSWNKWLMRMPLILLPLTVYWRTSYNITLRLILCLALPLVWIDLASMLNYALHADFYNQMVLESKPIPVYSIIYHIEFSVYQSIVALSLLHLILGQKQKPMDGMLFGLLLSCFIILFIALHILSARTGILMFWSGAVGLLGIRFQLSTVRKWKVILAIGIAFLATLVIPTLRNRIVNTTNDLTAVLKGGDLNHQSFGQRWEAWNAAIRAANSKPWLGYGMDKVHEAMTVSYQSGQSHLDQLNRINPHNQFLEVAVQSGYTAVFLLLVALIGIVVFSLKKLATKHMVFIVFALAIAMCFESLLERQAGTWVVVLALSGFLFPNNSNK